MKIRIGIDGFKGEIPRLSDRTLPGNHAQRSENSKLRSNDLVPLRENAVYDAGIAATTRVIDIIRKDGEADVVLEADDAEAAFARGYAKDDAGRTSRTYYTSPSHEPRVTTYEKAIDGARPYPAAFLKLGVPYPFQFRFEATDTADGLRPIAAPDFDSLTLEEQASANAFADYTVSETGVIEGAGGKPEIQGALADGPKFAPYISGVTTGGENIITETEFEFFHTYPSPLPLIYTYLSAFRFGADLAGTGLGIRFTRADYGGGVTDYMTLSGGHESWSDYYGSTSINYTALPAGSLDDGQVRTLRVNTTRQANGKFTVTAELFDNLLNSIASLTSEDVEMPGEGAGAAAYTNDNNNDPDNGIKVTVNHITIDAAGVDFNATSYVTTFVNELGEEGPPSFPSVESIKADGLTVNVSNIEGNDATDYDGYGLEKVRLYRFAPGADGDVLRLVKEVNIFATRDAGNTIVDDVDNIDLKEILQTTDFALPPATGQHIVALPNGIMAMADGREIVPSEQYQPHAYPLKYRLSLDFPVVKLIAMNTTLVALTTSSPYLIVGSAPENLSVVKIPVNYGCTSPRSAALWKEFGAVYASTDGLVAVNESGARLLTEDFYTKDGWAPFAVDGVMCGVHDDVLYISTPTGEGRVFDPRESGSGISRFVPIADQNTDVLFVDSEGDIMYLAGGGTLHEFEGGTARRVQLWRSKNHQLPRPAVFTAAEVRLKENDTGVAQTLELKLYRNGAGTPFAQMELVPVEMAGGVQTGGGTIAYLTPLRAGVTIPLREFTLPDQDEPAGEQAVCRELVVELDGTATVESVEVAEDMEELE